MRQDYWHDPDYYLSKYTHHVSSDKLPKSQMGLGSDADATQMYLQEIGYEPLLTPEEEITFSQQAKQGDQTARERMINGNLRLVVKIARGYLHRGLSLADLIEEGNLGLMRAVEKFNPDLGFRFSTYATWWIRQAVERAIMNQSRTVRLPIHMLKRITKCFNAIKQLSTELDHPPTLKEISLKLEKPIDEIEQLLVLTEGALSIDAPVTDDYEHSLIEALADQSIQDPQEVAQSTDVVDHLYDWLESLPEKHQQVIIRRFGLLGYEVGTLEQVGEEVGLTRERVRQIQIDALKRMKVILEAEGIDPNEVLGDY